jgi:hypothetical protein
VSDLSELFERLADGPVLLATAFASGRAVSTNGSRWRSPTQPTRFVQPCPLRYGRGYGRGCRHHACHQAAQGSLMCADVGTASASRRVCYASASLRASRATPVSTSARGRKPFMSHSRRPSKTCSDGSRSFPTWSGVAFPKPASLQLLLYWSGEELAPRRPYSTVA